MKEKFKKITLEKLFVIFIVIQPIIDIITSIIVKNINPNMTIGIFMRTIFIFISVVYSLLKSEKKIRLKIIIYYFLVFTYAIIYLVTCYMDNGKAMLFIQIKELVKAYYLPILLVSFIAIYKKTKYCIDNKYLNCSLIGYVLVIFLGKVFGFAYPSYNVALCNEGTMGLFFAANEIGAIISILSPIIVIELLKSKENYINKIAVYLIIFAILEIGTKVPFLALIALLIVCIGIMIIKIVCEGQIKKIKNSTYAKNIVTIIIIACSIYSVLGYTPIGINLNKNYAALYEKKEDSDISENKKEKTITAVVSGRNDFLKNNLKDYNSLDSYRKIIGKGYLKINDGQIQVNKLVEMDFFDIFFAHGILGYIIYFIPFIAIAIKIIILIWKNIKKIISNLDIILYLYSVCIGLGIAAIAGHVLVAPAVSTYIVLIMLKLYDKLEEKEA